MKMKREPTVTQTVADQRLSWETIDSRRCKERDLASKCVTSCKQQQIIFSRLCCRRLVDSVAIQLRGIQCFLNLFPSKRDKFLKQKIGFPET